MPDTAGDLWAITSYYNPLGYRRRRANYLDRRRGLFGLAWAAERSLMERHGFYDALVVGSGDRALACAALGRPRDAIDTMRMGTAGARHYAAWAQRFHADVQGRVGAV